ncbi:hypothetical protein Tco_1256025 [Tanacetum coccineum]
MSMTIQSSVKDKILATPSETSKVENAPAEMLRDMDQQMEKRADDANVVTDELSRKERVKPRHVRAMAMTIQYGVREMILTAQSKAFKQENVLAERLHGLDQHMERKEDESSYFIDHAVKGVRDAIGFEYWVASLSGWTKSLVLWAEIGESSLTRPYPVAYRLRLLEELSGVHDTFHVSNLKNCLADANLHVPLNEIKIDKTLLRWNSKRGPEFTWEGEDYMKSKYPQLFVDRAIDSAS